jgi:hypothetical protein
MHIVSIHRSAGSSSSQSGPTRVARVGIFLGHLLSRAAGALVALCLWGALLVPIYMALRS